MKRTLMPLCALLLGCAMLLGGCSNLETLQFKDDQYVDKKNDIIYLPAPLCYEAVSVKKEGYARIKQNGREDETLYEISGVDPTKMLANELYEVFYASDVTLPALWDMQTTEIYICETQDITAQLFSITDAADIEALISIYRDGSSFSHTRVPKETSDEHLYLKFLSRTHPSLYFCLEYLEFEEEFCLEERIDEDEPFVPAYDGVEVTFEDYEYQENGEWKIEHLAVYHFGNGILYDRATGKCFAAGDLVSKYINEAT